jgi:hypothetical protein
MLKLVLDSGPIESASIVIEDDAGGVPPERLLALVRLGEEPTMADAIGVWGEGLKVAAVALGNEISIYTRYGSSTPVLIRISKEWLASDSWEVPVFELEKDSLPPATTRIVIKQLNKPLASYEIRAWLGNIDTYLKAKQPGLGMIYGQYLDDQRRLGRNLTVRVEHNEGTLDISPITFATESDIIQNLTFFPGFEPSWHLRTFRTSGRPEALTVKALVGLRPEQRRDLAGVSMYGKGRLFELSRMDSSVGFGTRGRATLPASHPTMWRLQTFLFFDTSNGGSDLIPWTAPAKWGYNSANRFADDIRDFIREIAEPYAIFTRHAKRVDLLPFSMQFRQLDVTARKTEFETYCEGLWSELPRALRDAKLPLDAKRVITWDHDREALPLGHEAEPRFNSDVARALDRVVQERDGDAEARLGHATIFFEQVSTGLAALPTFEIESHKDARERYKVTIKVAQSDYEVLESKFAGRGPSEVFQNAIDSILAKLRK